MKKLKKQYCLGEIQIEDIKKFLPGYKGHLMRGHIYRLRNAVLSNFVLVKKWEE